MTDEQIIGTINRALADEFEQKIEDLTPEAHLIDDLGLDSLDFVDMVVVLQNAFGVSLREDPTIQAIRTVGEIHELVIAKKRELDAAP
ncbi:MAG: acyl carrier protein [Victivallales bacterium]|jgi:acyl carrier protein|nr:acyl carrier protein [Victivallales bacterium]MBT7300579.1 acyl carrier protein [Victivallales bacterium]